MTQSPRTTTLRVAGFRKLSQIARMIARARASAVCVAHQHVLVVRLEDPLSRAVFSVVPGGLIEPGESPAQAAEREVREETGVQVQIDAPSERIEQYPFTWAGVTYDTTTHFFRARLSSSVDGVGSAAVDRVGSAAVDRLGSAEGAPDLPAIMPRADTPAYQLAAYWLPLSEAEHELGFHPVIWAATYALLC